ncbi:uncharacterized protein N7459_004719 [Penicillium hispanicum]|uniref:uncharacterized protein n=1 Tax=Penicillium hispanicum TaxID=1080232 RepID=UPI00253F9034|nr:uncharacterized protein N7459_004719 [Penicillium hispanicum]KAJ5584919.1 hypothetical protein N7459_004719 [Penicillium hispanicum]
MRVSSLIPMFAAVLPALVAAEDCEFYIQPATDLYEPVTLKLACPPPSSLGEGESYSEASIDTNKCLMNHFGALEAYADGNAWASCDGRKVQRGENDVLESAICGPATTMTSVAISKKAPPCLQTLVLTTEQVLLRLRSPTLSSAEATLLRLLLSLLRSLRRRRHN